MTYLIIHLVCGLIAVFLNLLPLMRIKGQKITTGEIVSSVFFMILGIAGLVIVLVLLSILYWGRIKSFLEKF